MLADRRVEARALEPQVKRDALARGPKPKGGTHQTARHPQQRGTDARDPDSVQERGGQGNTGKFGRLSPSRPETAEEGHATEHLFDA